MVTEKINDDKVATAIIALKKLNATEISYAMWSLKVFESEEKTRDLIYRLGGTPDDELDDKLGIAFDEGYEEGVRTTLQDGASKDYVEGYKMAVYQNKEVKPI